MPRKKKKKKYLFTGIVERFQVVKPFARKTKCGRIEVESTEYHMQNPDGSITVRKLNP